MILPYFNCLLVVYAQNAKEIEAVNNSLFTDYFDQYFSIRFDARKGINIFITSLQKNIKASITDCVKQKVQKVLKELKPSLYKINNSYTFNDELKMMHEALGQMTVQESILYKGAAKIQNLSMLKSYYQRFRKEGEMKQFLKGLLVEQISKERRTINYRKAGQIRAIIRLMQDQLRGQIVVVDREEEVQSQQVLHIVLIEERLMTDIQQMFALIQKRYTIDNGINQQITRSFINDHFTKKSRHFVWHLTNSLLLKQRKKQIQQFHNFGINIALAANLKYVLLFGLKLVEEQKVMKQEFMKFVNEMKQKYSKITMTYIQGFKNFLSFNQQRGRYMKTRSNQSKLKKYLFSYKLCLNYSKLKRQKIYSQCRMIQNCLRSFIVKKIAEKKVIQYFQQRKHKQKLIFEEYYNKIVQIYNRNQLSKLEKHNKYKYGFSCCTVMLSIKNHSGYSSFDPHRFLNLVEKANRYNQLFVKINCSKFNVKLTSIQGRTVSLGHNLSNYDSQLYNSSQFKQNLSKNGSFCFTSRVNNKTSLNSSVKRLTNSNSMKSLSTVTSLKSSFYDSKLFFDEIKSHSQHKQSAEYVLKGDDYELILDEVGQLKGRGSNQFGQIGLGTKKASQKFVSIIPNQKIKLFSSLHGHTVAVTMGNKIFYFGKEKGVLGQSFSPSQLVVQQNMIIKQVMCSLDDTFLLTERNKVYSINKKQYIRIAKGVELQFDNFYLVRTGTFNLEIVYLIAFWTNSIDKVQRKQLYKYLTNQQKGYNQNVSESILIDNQTVQQKASNYKREIAELSDILQESGCWQEKC